MSRLANVFSQNPPPAASEPHISVGPDRNLSTLADAMTDAVMLRNGVPLPVVDANGEYQATEHRTPNGGTLFQVARRQPHDRAREFRHLSFVEMCQQWLAHIGVPAVHTLSRRELCRLAMSSQALQTVYPQVMGRVMATGDFAAVLGNATNRTLRRAYLETPATWRTWANFKGVRDYRPTQAVQLSDAPALSQRQQGADPKYTWLSDIGQAYAVQEHEQHLAFTHQAQVNDDLSALDRIGQIQADACVRLEEDAAYAPLLNNQVMDEDNLALFEAGTHGNYIAAGGGAAVSVATLSAGAAAMGLQRGPRGATLDLVPAVLIVPMAALVGAQQLVASINDPSAAPLQVNNPFNNQLTVVGTSRIDRSAAPKRWILAASNRRADTVEVAFLQDEPAPVLNRVVDPATGDVEFHVRHSVGAAAIDWRSLYANDGQ